MVDNEEMSDKETAKEVLTKIIKKNTNRILHERNKYVFLASVAEDVICNDFIYSEIVAFLLVSCIVACCWFRKAHPRRFGVANLRKHYFRHLKNYELNPRLMDGFCYSCGACSLHF